MASVRAAWVCLRTYGPQHLPVTALSPERYMGRPKTCWVNPKPEVLMLIALALLLLVLAIVGGIAIHPLLFLIAVLAVVAFVATRL